MSHLSYPDLVEESVKPVEPNPVPVGLRMQPLDPGFTVEVDRCDAGQWAELLARFDDANIYQTWAYAEVLGQRGQLSTLVLKKDGNVVAVAQARLANVPLIGAGIAYVRWGPLWRLRSEPLDITVFRQAVRALRNEYVGHRNLVLRVFPIVVSDESLACESILREEGFGSTADAPGRTILMDLRQPIEEIKAAMKSHWKRELKVAEKGQVEVLEGNSEELFDRFIAIYKVMVARKKFVEPNDIFQFRKIQSLLPESQKMRILLCVSGEEVYSGVITSAIGNTAVYLFGATSDTGLKSRGSYLLQWKILPWLKERGIETYNLNGINPAANPGTYKFKHDFAGDTGRDVYYLGRFDASVTGLSALAVSVVDHAQKARQQLRKRLLKFRK